MDKIVNHINCEKCLDTSPVCYGGENCETDEKCECKCCVKKDCECHSMTNEKTNYKKQDNCCEDCGCDFIDRDCGLCHRPSCPCHQEQPKYEQSSPSIELNKMTEPPKSWDMFAGIHDLFSEDREVVMETVARLLSEQKKEIDEQWRKSMLEELDKIGKILKG